MTIKSHLELTHRPVEHGDVERICTFALNAEELFHLYPKADYPLTPKQLRRAIQERTANTVIVSGNEVVAFANLNKWEPNGICAIGNVCVAQEYRAQGIGSYLIDVMINAARQDFNASSVEVACFETNPGALELYQKIGFYPYKEERRFDKSG